MKNKLLTGFKIKISDNCFNFIGGEIFKGCVCYILASFFLSLKDSTCQTRKNAFYFTSRALFILDKIKF